MNLRLLNFFAVFITILLSSCNQQTWNNKITNQINEFALTVTARSSNHQKISKETQTPIPILQPESSLIYQKTAEAIQHFELSEYNLSPDYGKLGWIHQPFKITSDVDSQVKYRQDFSSVVVSDFIIVADITWDTTSLSSGCGFSLRTHGTERELNRYVVVLNRFPHGHIQFTALVEGQPANLREIYLNEYNLPYSPDNKGTNRLAIVANANVLSIYLNQYFIDAIDVFEPPEAEINFPPAPIKPLVFADESHREAYSHLENDYLETIQQVIEKYKLVIENFKKTKPFFTNGFAGFAAVNDFGTTTCQFTNAWLWDFSSQNNP